MHLSSHPLPAVWCEWQLPATACVTGGVAPPSSSELLLFHGWMRGVHPPAACMQKHPCTSTLTQHGACPDRAGAAEALLTGCGEGRQAFVDTEDDKGRTALSHAARYGSLDSIAVLAAHQADMFHADTDGRTPLDIAEECGRLEAAMQLRRYVWLLPMYWPQ